MASVGICALCNLDVSDEEYRREVDCPSKSCPGRVYHEDCIANYLRKTKYSKDRCTGFPCPVILSTGKPCPGYVCKMHSFFPMNQKKKQARMQAAAAAAAAAAASRAKPAPAKTKTGGVQVAIAAIQRAESGGSQIGAVRVVNNLKPTVSTPTPPPIRGPVIPPAQQQSFIPGLDREELERRVAALRAEAKAGNSGKTFKSAGNSINPLSKVGVRVSKQGTRVLNDDSSSDEERLQRTATVWDAFAKPLGQNGELNYYDLEWHNRNGGGHFTAKMQKRLAGKESATPFGQLGGFNFGNSSSESEFSTSWSASDPNREVSSSPDGGGDGDCYALIRAPYDASKSRSQPDRTTHSEMFETVTTATTMQEVGGDTMIVGTESKTDNGNDLVLEYDIVFAVEDGSYLVFDNVSNAYVGLEDLYGPAPKLVDCPAEDGNIYRCVAVHQPQLERRMLWQEAWVQMQFNNDAGEQEVAPPLPSAQQQLEQEMWAEVATLKVPVADVTGDRADWVVPDLVPSAATTSYTAALTGQGVQASEVLDPVAATGMDDDTDVESLMQLLCV